MRRALGKGLSQLLGEQAEASPTTAPVEAIVPNQRQPRTQFDAESLNDLAGSIREHGVLLPLLVRPIGEGRYELIAGERRLRAAKLAGLKEVPVVIRTASAQASLEIALIENVQREDITAMECARAYRQLSEEFGMTQEQIAQRVGKTRAAVSNTLRLLKLPERIQVAIQEGVVSEGHARALLSEESAVRQAALFERIVRDGLSVREAERITRGEAPVSGGKKGAPTRTPKAPTTDPNWRPVEEGLSEFLGAPVKLTKGEIGGRITVEFYSDDDLQRILDVLGFAV